MKWMFRAALVASVLMIAACTGGGGEVVKEKPVTLDTDLQKAGYGVGMTIAQQIKSDRAVEFDLDAVKAGFLDGLAGSEPKVTAEQVDAAMQAVQKAAMEKQMQERATALAARIQENDKFLAENAAKDGVKTTESGLQYKVIKEGDAKGKSPSKDDIVVVDYEGKFIDGKMFDSSIKRGKPATFPVGGVIPGWTEILQMMKPGDKWEVVVPPNLGYGNDDVGPIPGASILVFDIDLKEVKAKAEPKAEKE